MSYWQHNLDLLKVHLPTIHEWAVQYPERPPTPPDSSESCPPAGGGTTGGFDADAWFDDLAGTEWVYGLLLGFGDGDHVERLVTEYPGRGLIILEPEPDAFLRACHDRDLAPIVQRPDLQLMLIHQPDARQIAHALFQNLRERLTLGKIVMLNWPPYEQRHSAFWTDFHARITEAIKQDATNHATYRRYSLAWQRNVWANLPYAAGDPGANALFDAFRDRPAILVASGPSLAKNIHLLPEVKGKALIVAAGSGIEPLRKAGITPDLVLSFDASEQNVQPFLDLDETAPPLVYSGVIYPQVVADYPAPRFVMSVDVYPFEGWLYRQLGQDKGEVSSGPSVANVTWDLLMRCGCDPIVLVGQDLALTGGRTHVDGVAAATALTPSADEPGYEWVDGVDGEKVLTTTVMMTMLMWFEQRIHVWARIQAEHGAAVQRTIDATEGGARIEGTELMTLREAIDAHCREDFDPPAAIARLHREHTPAPVPATELAALKDRLRCGMAQLTAQCDRSQQPIATLQALSTNGVTTQQLEPLATSLANLDGQLSAHELYRHFLEPALRQHGHQYTVLSNQLRKLDDPQQTAQLLASLYEGYFNDTRRVIREIGEML